MIELYTAATGNGVRARIGVEECGLPYALHVIHREKGEHRTPEFLALNPSAQLPVIVDDEGPGGRLVLSQSAAILMYCAEKAGKFLPRDPARRPAFLEALMSASTDVAPTVAALSAVAAVPGAHEPTVELFRAKWRHYLAVWDRVLGRQRYCSDDEVTIVDFSLFASWWRMRSRMPEACQGFPNLERWAAEIGNRPAVRRALAF